MRDPSWGTVGAVLDRYDGWTTGTPVKRRRVDLPVDDNKFYPKAMDIAGGDRGGESQPPGRM